MEDCIFCKIIKKEIPSTIIYEDDKVIAFNDVNPAAPIHILVVPKKHIETLLDVSDQDNELISYVYQIPDNSSSGRLPSSFLLFHLIYYNSNL